VNILTPKRFITPTSTAMANNSCLIEVEKWDGPAGGSGAAGEQGSLKKGVA
jgi:hypothetical protein